MVSHVNDITWLYIPTAFVLGMAHAIEPGHSKTVVASYLISIQGKTRDAVWLGLTVTTTHTIVVFALAVAALALGSAFPMERVQHGLQLISSWLVFLMGLWLLRSRWREWRHAHGNRHTCEYVPVDESHHDHAHPPLHAHEHTHPSRDPHHGHSHAMPTGQRFTFRQLLTFGLSGGLVPCPAALAILILAVGLGKPVLGLATVVVFSIGLAITLIGIGIAVCRGVALVGNRFEESVWLERLPLLSSLVVTVLGLWMFVHALMGHSHGNVTPGSS